MHGKWYGDACAAMFAMELIGERWSLAIVRELMFGGRRFSDIRAGLPGLSAKVLTERLEGLESSGIVTRVVHGGPAPARLYALTPWGLELEPVLQALGRWSVQSPQHSMELPLSPVSLMLSLRTMLDPVAAGDLEMGVRFEVGADTFEVHLVRGDLRVTRGSPERVGADLVFRAPTANAYLDVFHAGVPLDAPGVTLELQGDHALAKRFLSCFRMPAMERRAPPSQA